MAPVYQPRLRHRFVGSLGLEVSPTAHLSFESHVWCTQPTPFASRSSQIRNATKYKGHTIYNPTKSSSAKEADGSWNISYGDGSSASGNVYSETVTLGDLAIPGQAVELAKKLSSSFLQDSGNDGLLGLAWPAINTVYPRPVATPVENLINKKLIDPVRLHRSIYAQTLG